MQRIKNTELPADSRDFIVSLNKHQVEYLLIGGFAVGAYGYMRATSDFDIFINAREDNAKKMMAACIEFGIPRDQLHNEMFLVSKMIRNRRCTIPYRNSKKIRHHRF